MKLSLLSNIPRKETFEIDEGTYRAVLESVIIDHQKNQIRFRFRITHPIKDPRTIECAGKTYSLTNLTELATDLYSVLGDELENICDESGEIELADMQKLEGLNVTIKVQFMISPNHDEPFRQIVEMGP